MTIILEAIGGVGIAIALVYVAERWIHERWPFGAPK